jgi:hypothetical protein
MLVDPVGLPPLRVGLRADELKRRVERGAQAPIFAISASEISKLAVTV